MPYFVRGEPRVEEGMKKEQDASSRRPSVASFANKLPFPTKRPPKVVPNEEGTKGIIKRRKSGTSGLFNLKMIDDEATMESAAAAEQMMN